MVVVFIEVRAPRVVPVNVIHFLLDVAKTLRVPAIYLVIFRMSVTVRIRVIFVPPVLLPLWMLH